MMLSRAALQVPIVPAKEPCDTFKFPAGPEVSGPAAFAFCLAALSSPRIAVGPDPLAAAAGTREPPKEATPKVSLERVPAMALPSRLAKQIPDIVAGQPSGPLWSKTVIGPLHDEFVVERSRVPW